MAYRLGCESSELFTAEGMPGHSEKAKADRPAGVGTKNLDATKEIVNFFFPVKS